MKNTLKIAAMIFILGFTASIYANWAHLIGDDNNKNSVTNEFKKHSGDKGHHG